MSGYLQSNALGLVLPKDQSLGTTLGAPGLSTIGGPGTFLQSNHLSTVLNQMGERDASIAPVRMGEGQTKNPFNSGISSQQASENNPFGYGEQKLDPGQIYNSIYHTGQIIG